MNGRRGARAGVGVFYGDGDARNVSRPLSPDERHTNQRAELHALAEALRAERTTATTTTTSPLTIYSDSKYAICAITVWSKQWRQSEWCKKNTGEPVKNRDIIERAADDWEALQNDARRTVRVVHVRGHSGDPGNEAADQLAVRGAKLSGGPRVAPY